MSKIGNASWGLDKIFEFEFKGFEINWEIEEWGGKKGGIIIEFVWNKQNWEFEVWGGKKN